MVKRTRISTLSNTCFHIIKYTFPHHRTRISVCHFVGVYVYAGAINRTPTPTECTLLLFMTTNVLLPRTRNIYPRTPTFTPRAPTVGGRFIVPAYHGIHGVDILCFICFVFHLCHSICALIIFFFFGFFEILKKFIRVLFLFMFNEGTNHRL